MSFNPKKAHRHSAFHRIELLASRACGCFKCLEIYTPDSIQHWSDQGRTALCPYCGTSAVIGDASKYPIDGEFLSLMRQNFAQ